MSLHGGRPLWIYLVMIHANKLSRGGGFPLGMADCVWRMKKLIYFWVCFAEKWAFVGVLGERYEPGVLKSLVTSLWGGQRIT